MGGNQVEVQGPQVGALLPDFSIRTTAGRTIHRREFKGRRHLVVCFAHPATADGGRALRDALVARSPELRAERAEVLFVPSEAAPPGDESAYPFPVVAESSAALRAAFGAVGTGLVLVADRYGEIALREGLADPDAIPALDPLVATLSWLEMRCSL